LAPTIIEVDLFVKKIFAFEKNIFLQRNILLHLEKICGSIPCMNRNKYIDRLKKESEKLTYTQLAAKIGVHYVTLWRVIKGKSPGSLNFWDAVFAYYKRPRKK
jgi:hypothetical protein